MCWWAELMKEWTAGWMNRGDVAGGQTVDKRTSLHRCENGLRRLMAANLDAARCRLLLGKYPTGQWRGQGVAVSRVSRLESLLG
jgi:hypothetical protein